MITVGIDEAGYGPTLGPLVVSAAAFRITGAPAEAEVGEAVPDLWVTLGDIVSRKPRPSRIPVDDSKRLYRPGKGLSRLEEGILPFLRLRDGSLPADLRSLLGRLLNSREASDYLDLYPWYRERTVRLPTGAYPNHIARLARKLGEALQSSDTRFLGLASVPIEVLHFNSALSEHGNKAMVPFAAIGNLLSRLWRAFPGERLEVAVDRQGGRTHYAPLLFRSLEPRGIVIERQTADTSIYRLRGDGRKGPLRVAFTTRGEARSLPVALASMASKYLRELHMKLFNQFWCELQHDLRPTAGYPVDARRFLAETSRLRARLGIDEALLIRLR